MKISLQEFEKGRHLITLLHGSVVTSAIVEQAFSDITKIYYPHGPIALASPDGVLVRTYGGTVAGDEPEKHSILRVTVSPSKP